VCLAGKMLNGLSPYMRARAGLARTFQAVRLFNRLTVAENVALGAIGVGMSPRRSRRRAAELLARLRLADVAELPAGALPYGHERRVALARAMAADPVFLLLDEPAAGLDEAESQELGETITAAREELRCGVLIVEHDMAMIMRECDRVHVLDRGRTLAVGTPAEVQADKSVIEAYLGDPAESADAGR
jgi:ABC-type branched-subunit amino acid transport system ATPase component